ncbi:MAG: DUF2189 domain-containing protein [Gemmobacter sp.]|uniref:DUF2189 domain-containing protein n=1 Tax=Gemmobacter sp. TaxID=1898957 RepID=UPI00391DBC38
MLEPRPVVEPGLAAPDRFARDLPSGAALGWLSAGWPDLRDRPAPSPIYGLAVFVLSACVVLGLIRAGLPWLIFPALSGFPVAGPLLAIGLYDKSRRRHDDTPATLTQMLAVRPASGGQLMFAGLLSCLLVMLWLRAADLLYALFFGMLPFPGFDQIMAQLLTTPRGWAPIVTGSAIGGLSAGFAMAIILFSIPMLLERRVDALTALGTSFAITMQNLRAVLPWGAIVTLGFALSAATGLVGLIVIFPPLGHGTWHARVALRPPEESGA